MFWATLNFQVYFEANYLTTRCFRNAKTYFDHSTSHQNKSISHLDIWPSSNSSSQRVSPLYEGVDSILRILKNICVCEFRLGFLSYNNNNNKKKKKKKHWYYSTIPHFHLHHFDACMVSWDTYSLKLSQILFFYFFITRNEKEKYKIKRRKSRTNGVNGLQNFQE